MYDLDQVSLTLVMLLMVALDPLRQANDALVRSAVRTDQPEASSKPLAVVIQGFTQRSHTPAAHDCSWLRMVAALPFDPIPSVIHAAPSPFTHKNCLSVYLILTRSACERMTASMSL